MLILAAMMLMIPKKIKNILMLRLSGKIFQKLVQRLTRLMPTWLGIIVLKL
jgi:hypothetical protein